MDSLKLAIQSYSDARLEDVVVRSLGRHSRLVVRPLTNTADIPQDLGLDSLNLLEVVLDIEFVLQLEIPEDVWVGLSTVAEMVAALRGLSRTSSAV